MEVMVKKSSPHHESLLACYGAHKELKGNLGQIPLNKKISVDSPFCHLSTCPIRYLFNTLQQFPSGPLLLV